MPSKCRNSLDAGSSLKLVGSASRGRGSTSLEVGTATFRTVGNATLHLGNTSFPGVLKESNINEKKEESSVDERDKKLLVMNMDEVRTFSSLGPKKVDGSSQDFKRDEQKASSVKSEDGLQRRFSESLSLFRRRGVTAR